MTGPDPSLAERGTGSEYYWPEDQYGVAPATTEGKVFFRLRGGNYVCSATVVNSPNRSLVWTAGHCVAGERRWSKKVMFCPAYFDGACPYGEWVAKTLFTTGGWFDKGNFSYDLGAAVMYKLGGQKIVNALGGQGIAWNQSRQQYWTAIGYPAAPPFDGMRLYACEDVTKFALNPPRPGPNQIAIDCSMTGGSSGGGWLIDIAPDTGLGWVNGVTSLGIDATSELATPYQGREARRLWKAAGS
jgi:V8-like Glu-specific endopeptidase